MITVTVAAKAIIKGSPPEVEEEIKQYLSIGNPFFGKKLSMGLSVWGIEQTLKFYSKDEDKNLVCPVGALPQILEFFYNKGLTYEIKDNRVSLSAADYFDKIKFNATLRKYQADIVSACLESTIGVIEAKTGSGKTLSFIKMVTDRKQNTLILVNTIELGRQTIAAFEKYTNLKDSEGDFGFIGDGHYKVKPITICLLQSLQSIVDGHPEKLQEIQNYFGQVIADETHIIAAETYFAAISALPAKYKFGFSATPKREDGLTKVIFFATGPLIHKVPDEEVDPYLIIPTYEVVNTAANYPLISTTEYQDMITYLGLNEERNKLILERFAKDPDTPSCFLCLRQAHVEYLHSKIPRSVKLISSMGKKERAEAMRKLISGEAIHVVSTFALFSTGIDIPRLENLYLCAPMKSFIKLKQSAGRLMRKALEKSKALIIDFVDKKIGLLAGQAKKRKKILMNL